MYTSENNQLGRSMVEMLGVLAIIGVLSVGAIAGYSKAMFKHKANQAINQVATISQLVRNHFYNQKSYEGLRSHNLQLLKSILSESVDDKSTIVDDDTRRVAYVISPFNSGILIDDDTWGGGEYKAFTINYFGLSSYECMVLATADWTAINVHSVYVSSGIYTDTVGEYGTCKQNNDGEYYSEEGFLRGCVGGTTVPIPIPVSLAANVCKCRNPNSCDVLFTFE